ncbi:MAG: cell division protein FtsL [Lachnospiraceae bacterium]
MATAHRTRERQHRTPDNRNRYYVQGNTVRKFDVTREMEHKPQPKVSNRTRKNRDKAKHMSAGYVLFLCAALVASGFILVNYIGLQSDITNSVQHISRLEKELNDLKLANDEEYSRITSSVDLEEIKRIAIQELGMQYAEEGQIISFASERNDYVKQMADIPQ